MNISKRMSKSLAVFIITAVLVSFALPASAATLLHGLVYNIDQNIVEVTPQQFFSIKASAYKQKLYTDETMTQIKAPQALVDTRTYVFTIIKYFQAGKNFDLLNATHQVTSQTLLNHGNVQISVNGISFGHRVKFNDASLTVGSEDKNIVLGLTKLTGVIGLSANQDDYVTAGTITPNAAVDLTVTEMKGANGIDAIALLKEAGKTDANFKQTLTANTPNQLNVLQFLGELDEGQEGVNVGYLKTIFGDNIKIKGILGPAPVELIVNL